MAVLPSQSSPCAVSCFTTSDPLVCRPALRPLSHASRGGLCPSSETRGSWSPAARPCVSARAPLSDATRKHLGCGCVTAPESAPHPAPALTPEACHRPLWCYVALPLKPCPGRKPPHPALTFPSCLLPTPLDCTSGEPGGGWPPQLQPVPAVPVPAAAWNACPPAGLTGHRHLASPLRARRHRPQAAEPVSPNSPAEREAGTHRSSPGAAQGGPSQIIDQHTPVRAFCVALATDRVARVSPARLAPTCSSALFKASPHPCGHPRNLAA